MNKKTGCIINENRSITEEMKKKLVFITTEILQVTLKKQEEKQVDSIMILYQKQIYLKTKRLNILDKITFQRYTDYLVRPFSDKMKIQKTQRGKEILVASVISWITQYKI